MAITMKDIARMANVSVVTVSRAINNKPDISKKTKKLILEIIKKHNYVPNYLAKSLVTKKTKSIGLTIMDIIDPFFAKIVRGADDVAKGHGYNIILTHTDNDPDKELNAIRFLAEKKVDGFLLCPVQRDRRYIKVLEESPIPYVLIARHANGKLKCDCVLNDNIHGAYLAVNYLLKKGHKEIHYLIPSAKFTSTEERIHGCRKAVKSHRLPQSSLHIHRCEENMNSFYDFSVRLFKRKKRISAVFVWDDILAIAVQKAAIDNGLRIPEDVAIIGYDDIDIADYLSKPLTTVEYPAYQIGAEAAKILIEKIESDAPTKVRKVVLKPKLIIKETA